MARRFVALDRDGTLIVERNYLSDPRDVALLPRTSTGLRRFRELGFGLVVVTNQSGIGRGYFTRERVDEIHQRMYTLLEAEGITIDGLYICPHTPDDRCDCRKPGPAMLQNAARDLGFDPRESIMIGDKECDIELGQAVGATTILVRTGYGATTESTGLVAPDFVVDDLAEAAEVVARIEANAKSSLPYPG